MRRPDRIGPEPWASGLFCLRQLLAGVMWEEVGMGAVNNSRRRKKSPSPHPRPPVFILLYFLPTSLSLWMRPWAQVTMATEESIIRIPPYHYIHVLDQNSNVSRVEVGPKTYIRQDNERLVSGLGCGGRGAEQVLLVLLAPSPISCLDWPSLG